jgi:hypothetical protein
LELHTSPWKRPEVTPLDLTPQANSLAADATGSHFAAALGNRVIACEPRDWHIRREVQESDWAIEVAISDDGALVAHASRKELVLTEVSSGARAWSLPREGTRALTFHPSGQHLVAVFQNSRIGIADVSPRADRRWRELWVEARRTVSPDPFWQKLQSVDIEELTRRQRARLELQLQRQIESWTKEYESAVSEKVILRMR